MGFKMIYWTHISASYFLKGCILETCGNFRKNGRFSGRIWPDWGNTARADMAGLGSIGYAAIMQNIQRMLYIERLGFSDKLPKTHQG